MKRWITIHEIVLCILISLFFFLLLKEKQYEFEKVQDFLERNNTIDSIRNIELNNIYPIK